MAILLLFYEKTFAPRVNIDAGLAAAPAVLRVTTVLRAQKRTTRHVQARTRVYRHSVCCLIIMPSRRHIKVKVKGMILDTTLLTRVGSCPEALRSLESGSC